MCVCVYVCVCLFFSVLCLLKPCSQQDVFTFLEVSHAMNCTVLI